MTVEQLIKGLQSVEDKSVEVFIRCGDFSGQLLFTPAEVYYGHGLKQEARRCYTETVKEPEVFGLLISDLTY